MYVMPQHYFYLNYLERVQKVLHILVIFYINLMIYKLSVNLISFYMVTCLFLLPIEDPNKRYAEPIGICYIREFRTATRG